MKKIFWIPKKDIIITLLFLYHFSGLNDFFPNFSSHPGVFSYYTSFLKISSRFSEYQNKYNQKSLFAVFDFATWAAGIYEHVRQNFLEKSCLDFLDFMHVNRGR